MSDDELLKDERFRGLRDELLRSAVNFFGKLGALLEGQNDRHSKVILGDPYAELGILIGRIGDKRQALIATRKALAIRRELASWPDDENI